MKFPKEEIENMLSRLAVQHGCYSGKHLNSKEVYNDINGELVNLFGW